MLRPAAFACALALAPAAAGAAEAPPPKAPAPTTWSYAAKTGIGSSYEAYVDGAYREGGSTGPISKVWFSIADGVLTETMYGLIHQAQIKSLRLALATSAGVALEGADTTSRTEYLHVDADGRPLSPAYRVTTRDKAGRFEIEKRIFTDPDRQSLFLRVTIRALKGPVTPHVLLEPHMANTGGGDGGRAGAEALEADEAGVFLTLRPSRAFDAASVGFLGASDGWSDLKDGRLDGRYTTTGAARGALMLTGRWSAIAEGQSATYDLAIGFGASRQESAAAAAGSLRAGYAETVARFNGQGAHVGWEDYLASLDALPKLRAQSLDGGKLLHASALALKVQEDRTYAGALIASLSTPWGDTVPADKPATGYKAVWPRDFYQCAMALAALGDRETPLAALRYLPRVQVSATTPKNRGAGGWFLQKAEVDGTPEWVAVQLDQTAMPIMLAWKLHAMGWLSGAEAADIYRRSLKPAADFLTDGGALDIDWNRAAIRPPFTQQERWEEQAGHSPSTTAAVITGLVAAADLARFSDDPQSAERYLRAADEYASRIEARMFTTRGRFGDGRYFLRINTDEDPDNDSRVESRNGQAAVAEDEMLDGGFLELVRYGVRRADDPHILASLPELDDAGRDDLHRVRYTFRFPAAPGEFPGWRRYGVDGYGEDVESGANYGQDGQMRPGQRGRVWPIFTGERGHYELALAKARGEALTVAAERVRSVYVRGMELFANEGLLLPEQVWDGVGAPRSRGYVRGEGTNAATPLAWSHAEYVKLLRSLADGEVWDSYPIVRSRYLAEAPAGR